MLYLTMSIKAVKFLDLPLKPDLHLFIVCLVHSYT